MRTNVTTRGGIPGAWPSAPIPASSITLGILAGGRATRIGGLDKAWLQRDGQPQVLRLAQRLASDVSGVIVSANRDCERYRAHGLAVVSDRIQNIGPLGGLDALAHAGATDWLFTLPVDMVSVNDGLLRSLVGGGGQGAFAEDDDGLQPLVALWRVDRLRECVREAIDHGDFATHALQSRLGMAWVRFDGVRFGNLNLPTDLVAAGVELP